MSKQSLHKRARTTLEIRKEIQEAPTSVSHAALARKYNLNVKTIYKWRKRDFIEDVSNAPHNHGRRKLNDADIQLIIHTRKVTEAGLDDLLDMVQPQLSHPICRAQLSNILKANGLTKSSKSKPREKQEFKKYEPGFMHVDCTYLPKLAGRQSKVFCAIDRTTKWAYVEVHPRKTANAAAEFMRNLIKKSPVKIHRVLTDNGAEFTHQLFKNRDKMKQKHVFEAVCEEAGIKRKLIKFRHPWTNGQVERFNGQLKSKTVHCTRYASQAEMEHSIYEWVDWYNKECKLTSLNRITPNAAVEKFLNLQPLSG